MKSAVLGLLVSVSSCSVPPAPRVVTPVPAGVVWSYEVVSRADFSLAIEATLRGPIDGALAVDEAAQRFLDDLRIEDDGAFRPFSPGDPDVAALCARSCRLRYRVRLGDAARELADVDTALLSGGAVFAPPSTWLLRPAVVPEGLYRFHVVPAPGTTWKR